MVNSFLSQWLRAVYQVYSYVAKQRRFGVKYVTGSRKHTTIMNLVILYYWFV